jgi:hypothetical protein
MTSAYLRQSRQGIYQNYGLSYQILYKKGVDNRVADAISQVSTASSYDISAISTVKPLWL